MANRNEKKDNNLSLSNVFFLMIVVLFIAGLLLNCFSAAVEEPEMEVITYNEFKGYVDAGEVDTVWYNKAEEYMYFVKYTDETRKLTMPERLEYEYSEDNYIKVPYPGSTTFREDMLSHDINLVIKSLDNSFISILPAIGTVIVNVLLIVLLFCSLQKIGEVVEEKKLDIEHETGVKFSDVIGHDEILDDIKFAVELLRQPEIGVTLNANVPKGLLFSGEPGTGKTLIAKAIAGEAEVPFMYMNASSFIEMYVGVGAKRVRELFKQARECSPCVVFIDEIDAVGKTRGSESGSSEDLRTINALLQEMDGFNASDGILVIAATNNARVLDKALTRSGRFDREIVISKPRDVNTRCQLFERYLKGKPLEDDVCLNELAEETAGFTGADIATICNEAALIALRRVCSEDPDGIKICRNDIEEAIDKKMLKGNRSKRDPESPSNELVACHEAGHAVMSYLRKKPIARAVTTGTTSGVGGFVLHADSNIQYETKHDFETDILICYAGRAAEEIAYGSERVTTGAGSDIQKATQLLLQYVGIYGFDADNGLVDINTLIEAGVMSKESLHMRVNELAKKYYSMCYKLLNDNLKLHTVLYNKLLEKECISGKEIYDMLEYVETN